MTSANRTAAPERSVVSPDDQPVTFVELFFDLVFVFSVTQLVGLFQAGMGWATVGEAVLIFWLVWWAWTQFTWTLNAADTTHPAIAATTLLATAVAFFMAVALPDAFHGRALFFAIPYVAVRAIGLVLRGAVADGASPSQDAAVRRFALLSLAGLAAVLTGALWSEHQHALWGLAIALDVVAALAAGGSADWNLHPGHFSERHGLFVIIALGETLIVSAAGVSGTAWTAELIGVAVVAVALTCALWWAYFPRVKPIIDRGLEAAGAEQRAALARDAFSLTHFVMLCGVVAYAVALEQAVHAPGVPFSLQTRAALGAGLALFLGGAAAAVLRCTGRAPKTRLALGGAAAVAVIALAGVPPVATLALAFVGVSLIAALESRARLAWDVEP